MTSRTADLESSPPPPPPRHKVFWVHQSRPQRLSLLELVLDEESVLMVLRRISLAAGSSCDFGDSVVVVVIGVVVDVVALIQG